VSVALVPPSPAKAPVLVALTSTLPAPADEKKSMVLELSETDVEPRDSVSARAAVPQTAAASVRNTDADSFS
jgi:hypothetical protein